MDDQNRVGKFKLFYRKGGTKILNKFRLIDVKEIARQKNKKGGGVELVEITEKYGGVTIDF